MRAHNKLAKKKEQQQQQQQKRQERHRVVNMFVSLVNSKQGGQFLKKLVLRR